MIYNKRKAGRRHDWGVVVLVLGSFSLPPLLYFRYILVYLYYSKKKNIHCASPALSSPALLSLVMLCHCCCGSSCGIVGRSWALSAEPWGNVEGRRRGGWCWHGCCLLFTLHVVCLLLTTWQDRINTVTAFDRVIPGTGPGLVLTVAHSEHTYIPIPFDFLEDFCYY